MYQKIDRYYQYKDIRKDHLAGINQMNAERNNFARSSTLEREEKRLEKQNDLNFEEESNIQNKIIQEKVIVENANAQHPIIQTVVETKEIAKTPVIHTIIDNNALNQNTIISPSIPQNIIAQNIVTPKSGEKRRITFLQSSPSPNTPVVTSQVTTMTNLTPNVQQMNLNAEPLIPNSNVESNKINKDVQYRLEHNEAKKMPETT